MRWKRRGVLRTASGAIIAGATVQVYLAGTSNAASIYEGSSGGAPVNQISVDSDGRYEYYVDAADYSAANRFKEVISKGASSTTLDNIPIVRWDPMVHQILDGELSITGTGHGITFADGTRQTTNASPGVGVTNTGDVSIAADTDANDSGEITLSTKGVARARVLNGGGLEIDDGGTWRQVATRDGSETLSNKTLAEPSVSDFSNANHDHSDAASGGALSSPTMTDPVLNGSLSGTAIKNDAGLGGALPSIDAVPTQAAVKTYMECLPQLITEWSQPDDDHPYLNAENNTTQGKATIKLPVDSEAWVHSEILAKATGADIYVDIDYMMSTSDNDPVNWGLAYAVGRQRLCDIPWKASTTYTIGDRICPSTPNGCAYEMIEGAAGYGSNVITGGTATAIVGAPEDAVDGNTTTYWLSIGYALGASPWWKYDLGSGVTKTFSKVRIYWGASPIPVTLTIQGGNNDSDWTTLYAGAPAGVTWEEFIFSNDTAYRYLKIVQYTAGDGTNAARLYEVEAMEALGSTGDTDSSEPTWPTTKSQTVVDNEITWKCVSIDNYDTVSLTGETAPAIAWTEGVKTFVIPGSIITTGDPVNILAIRKVDPPSSYWTGNLLVGGTASGSSEVAPHLPANACDNDEGTYYQSDPLSDSPWWKYDFGEGNGKQINKIRILWYGTLDRPDTLTVHGSDNDSDWTQLGQFTPSAGGWEEFDLLSNTSTYRYYRLTGHTSGSAYGMKFVELAMLSYITNSGSDHAGDLHLIRATHRAVLV